jgi:3-oxoacyl-[acyl-carrier-protein] synthase II
MDKSREVVITGVGVVCPIGIGKGAYWQSMREGRSGVSPIQLFDARHLPAGFGGQIGEFNPKVYIKPRKSIKVMCREIQTGFASAAMAVEDAGLQTSSVDPDRFGVVFGSEMFYGEITDLEELFRYAIVDRQFQMGRFADRILADLYPLWMLKYLPNMVACHIGIGYDARGPNNTIVQGEASSLLALVECIAMIQRGQADVMLTGGTGSRLNLTSLMYRGDSNLSHRGEDPAGASRPFDRGRDGMVNGEGAAAFVLESRAHAESRGAQVLCHIPGHSRAFEVPGDSQTRQGDSLERTIRQAISASQIDVKNLGHVNAEGVSTVEDDAVEAAVIAKVLGETPVTGPKSYFGNLGAGTGAVEMVASVLSLVEGEIPRTLNYSQPDPNCPINVVHGQPLPTTSGTALILSRSGTGQVAAAVLQRR